LRLPDVGEGVSEAKRNQVGSLEPGDSG